MLAVDDPQGHVAGTFDVTTTDGVATVKRSDEDVDLTVSAETLGSLYLAGVGVLALHRAGRIDGTDEDVRRFAAMADLSEPPYCLTGF